MPKFEVSPVAGALGLSAMEVSPYLDQYWRDCDRADVYAAAFMGLHVDQSGAVVGQSWHVNGPGADWNDEFMRDIVSASEGEVG